jgi:hypothetical protein
LWLVGRDQRGGVAWQTLDVVIVPAGTLLARGKLAEP